MTSQNYTNYAHVIKATKDNLDALGITKKLLYDTFYDGYLSNIMWDKLDVVRLFEELASIGVEDLAIDVNGVRVNIDILQLRDDYDIGEGEAGTYIKFYEVDLFTYNKTPLHGILLDKNIEISRIDWVSYE